MWWELYSCLKKNQWWNIQYWIKRWLLAGFVYKNICIRVNCLSGVTIFSSYLLPRLYCLVLHKFFCQECHFLVLISFQWTFLKISQLVPFLVWYVYARNRIVTIKLKFASLAVCHTHATLYVHFTFINKKITSMQVWKFIEFKKKWKFLFYFYLIRFD